MTDLIFFCLGAGVVGAGIFYAGHRVGVNTALSKAGGELSKAEQELVALFRKATGKAPAAAPAGSAPAAGGASPTA